MLNGINPVIIFQFKKLLDDVFIPEIGTSNIPILSSIPTFVEEPPIPIYLSETVTGLFIDTEDKSVDILTDTETTSDGTTPDIKQRGISNSLSITLAGKKSSIGIMLLSAMIDKVFEKLTSNEYSISYLHGATTIFRGKISDFKISQNANTDLLQISVTITNGEKQPTATEPTGPTVLRETGTVPLG